MALNMRDSSRSSIPAPVVLVAGLLFQLTLGAQIDILGGSPNFMAAVAVAYALHADLDHAVIVGFAAGMLYDLTAPVPLGLMALLLTITTFTLAAMSRGMLSSMTTGAIRLIVLALLALFCVYALALVALGTVEGVLSALLGHGLATAAFTAVATLACMALLARSQDTGGTGYSTKTAHGRKKRLG